MKRYIGDILDGVGRFQALEVFLGFAQFVNVFPEGLGQLVDRVFRQVARQNMSILMAVVWTASFWFG